MIGIRVDVNQKVATGHIKRDIAIALCLRKMGQECLFISADDNCIPYLAPHNFSSIILDSKWDDMEGELDKIEKVIKENAIHSLLVDSYLVTEKYMQYLSGLTKVTYFDELGIYGFGCQQLINGVLEPPDYSHASGKAFTGPDYVSLRQEFIGLPPKKISPHLGELLITSGGTDNYHFCARFLEYILDQPRWKELQIAVAVGELSGDIELLKEKYSQSKRVRLHINAQNMSELMREADYVVTAAGTALYEVCAVGVAASGYALADNQLENALAFHNKGLVAYAGDFREEPQKVMERILEHMEQARCREYRISRAEKLQKMVDGKGAWRIAEALM